MYSSNLFVACMYLPFDCLRQACSRRRDGTRITAQRVKLVVTSIDIVKFRIGYVSMKTAVWRRGDTRTGVELRADERAGEFV